MTEQEICRDAIFVQDACNLLGVSKSFAQIVQAVWDNMKDENGCASMDDLRSHPAIILFVDKISDMVRRPDIWAYGKAYDDCKAISE